jgi:MFS family permease
LKCKLPSPRWPKANTLLPGNAASCADAPFAADPGKVLWVGSSVSVFTRVGSTVAVAVCRGLSLAWVVALLFVVSVKSESGRRRAIRVGPLLLTAGLITYGLLQVSGADIATVLIWATVLALAGVGIGLAWPLLGVAAMSSTHDPAEGGKAAAAITITQLIAFSITSALAGTLMSAGGDSAVDSARYVTLGIALLTLLGIFAAGIATRR